MAYHGYCSMQQAILNLVAMHAMMPSSSYKTYSMTSFMIVYEVLGMMYRTGGLHQVTAIIECNYSSGRIWLDYDTCCQ